MPTLQQHLENAASYLFAKSTDVDPENYRQKCEQLVEFTSSVAFEANSY